MWVISNLIHVYVSRPDSNVSIKKKETKKFAFKLTIFRQAIAKFDSKIY